MTGYLESIHIGDRLSRRHEAPGPLLSWIDHQCQLIISLDNLTPDEIRGVQRGVFELGLNIIDHLPFVCFRIFELSQSKGFGQPQPARLLVPWHECPFHLSRFDPQALPNFDAFRAQPNIHLALTVILTDWPGMVVKALRLFTVSPFFTQKLIEALLTTATAHTYEGYALAVNRIFDTYPTGAIGEGSRVRCKSGD
jgi:hypothetical protein